MLQAGADGSPAAQEALARLCETYWYPVYAYFRREGRSHHESEDLTQSCFAQILERRDLAHVHPAKGRFRSFLLAAARHHLLNDWQRSQRLKRGGGAHVFSIDSLPAEDWYRLEPVDEAAPEKQFDRRWAETLIEQVHAALEADCRAAGQTARFEVLRDFVLGDPGDVTYAEAGAKLGLGESAVTSAIHRLRARFRELLRREVARTLADPAEVDHEIRDLLSLLAA